MKKEHYFPLSFKTDLLFYNVVVLRRQEKLCLGRESTVVEGVKSTSHRIRLEKTFKTTETNH